MLDDLLSPSELKLVMEDLWVHWLHLVFYFDLNLFYLRFFLGKIYPLILWKMAWHSSMNSLICPVPVVPVMPRTAIIRNQNQNEKNL